MIVFLEGKIEKEAGKREKREIRWWIQYIRKVISFSPLGHSECGTVNGPGTRSKTILVCHLLTIPETKLVAIALTPCSFPWEGLTWRVREGDI